MRITNFCLIALVSSSVPVASSSSVLETVTTKAKSILNLSGKIVKHTTLPVYERVNGLPAFAVTTPWGSPYMIFDQLTPAEVARTKANNKLFSGSGKKGSSEEEELEEKKAKFRDRVREHNAMSEEEVAREAEMEFEMEDQSMRTRTTALYFQDPEDAMQLVDEMKQMGGGMDKADIRVMATTMGRAVRHASNLGGGLPTGQPVDEMTGRLDNSFIRYKIVPSRRELFYAATRCMGKERVGLFGDTREEDAKNVLASTREKQEGVGMPKKSNKNVKESPVRQQWKHMRGKNGVPVFYADGMKRKTGRKDYEIPLYMSYEDLVKEWNTLKQNPSNALEVPDQPPMVEVFNFVDIMGAMENNRWKKNSAFENAVEASILGQKCPKWVSKMVPDSVKRSVFVSKNIPQIGDDDIDKLVLIPSSRAIQFKESITNKGNGKARLPRMR